MRSRFLLLTSQIAMNSILGYVLMKVLAVKFGTSEYKDAFDIAYSVPFLILALSGFSFLNTVITAKFAALAQRRRRDMETVFCTILTLMGILLLCLAVVVVLYISDIVEAMAPGMSLDIKKVAGSLVIIFLPLVGALAIGTYLSGVLIAYGTPVAAEFCQIISRLGFVLYACIFGFNYTLREASISLVIFGCIGAFLEWLLIKRNMSMRYRPMLNIKDHDVVDIVKVCGGMLIVSFLAQISIMSLRRLASLDGAGSIAILGYALSLVAPIALLIGKPLSLTLGVDFIRKIGEAKFVEARKTAVKAVMISLTLGASASVLIYIFGRYLVMLLYGGGAFDSDSVYRTVKLLDVIIWSFPPHLMLWTVLMPIVNLRHRHAGAFLYSCGYLAQIVAAHLLFPHFGLEGLGWAYVICISTQAGLGVLFFLLSEIAREVPCPANL